MTSHVKRLIVLNVIFVTLAIVIFVPCHYIILNMRKMPKTTGTFSLPYERDFMKISIKGNQTLLQLRMNRRK